MKLLPACFQVRLDSFGGLTSKSKSKSKPRRTSARSKKSTASNDDAIWPLTSPAPTDLAFAGFIYKPTSASPDNVQCFDCGCQLDGWEPSDVPAYEHLTHSPTCGFAINICIRLRLGDPDRVEEDPLSEKMKAARRATFGDYWPLDTSAGYPGVEQMVEAGWFYDPTQEFPDGVTCPYCSLSLDSWDAGDDPLEEHRRRAESTSGCLFFTLKELYHPANIPTIPTKAKRTSRSSTKKAPAPKAKTTKTKAPPAKAPAQKTETVAKATKRRSDMTDTDVEEQGIRRSKRTRTSELEAPDWNTFSLPSSAMASTPPRGYQPPTPPKAIPPKVTPPKPASPEVESPEIVAPKVALPKVVLKKAAPPKVVRQKAPPKAAQRKVTQPKSTVSKPTVPMSTPPKATPPKARILQSTPPQATAPTAMEWEPVDIELFFEKENLPKIADLTWEEKQMTIEQFLLYEAKRQEENLRAQMMKQIEALDAQYARALAAIDAL